MALETYRQKRDFTTSPEPRGVKAKQRNAGAIFVVQKHAARRLHYDFRLEMDGVLKSWAVTRGPSLVPGEKRLAVHVEDHPLAYGDFEGTIPKGEYGGGSVIVWDRGHWTPFGDLHKGYDKGHLEFALDGEKLRGRWHLIRMRGRPHEKTENWLLIKGDDEAARAADAADILAEQPQSVKTGRKVEALAGEPPGWSSKTGKIDPAPKPRRAQGEDPSPPDPSDLKGAKKGALPSFVPPALATLVSKAPAGARWIHEIKYDGYRLEVRIEAGRVKLLTRSGLDWTKKFGKPLIEAFAALPAVKALIDGELVVENDAGASDFSALQAALSENRSDGFIFYAFDLLYLDGYDLRGVALSLRKEMLAQLLAGAPALLRMSAHFDQDGELIRRHACRLSLEGIVSKLRNAPYRSGRSKDWVKSKCAERQEFVIAGFVPSSVARKSIGSLVLGYYERNRLINAGRVGTGFTAAVAADLYERLAKIRVSECPFARRLTSAQARQVVYVKPQLVAEVEFRGWTADRNLRHASFRGLREDKPAAEIIREHASDPAEVQPKASVPLTHPDRLYWPEAGVTKEGLADYYAGVWKHMAPFVVGRPLSLLRCPGGIAEPCFFQKHAWKGMGRAIHVVPDPLNGSSGEELLSIEDLDGLISLVQGGVLEIHPWGATLAALEQPDMIIMDLDPGEGVAWADVITAAKELRERLAKFGLASFVKTSGGKGLHVVAPLVRSLGWNEVKAFTKRMAQAMAADRPDRYVATIAKSKRDGKILIDYLRNGRGATAVAAYSTRARAGAPVSMPLAWDELSPDIGPAYFSVANALTRLEPIGRDPWGDFHRAAVPLAESETARSKSSSRSKASKPTVLKAASSERGSGGTSRKAS